MSSGLGNNTMDDNPGMMEVTGKVLISTIIALVFVLIFVFLFNIYAKLLWSRRQETLDSHHQRTRQGHAHAAGVTVLRRGLDVAFLKTLPVIEFDPKEFKDGVLECSVCITEVEQGETTRILPKCNHAFHAECIDMWFHSHSTCPICRNPVSEQAEVSVESLLEQEQSTTNTFPTNVLFWGDETEVSTLTSQLEEATNNQVHPDQAPVLPFEPTSSSSSSNTNNDRLVKEDLVIDIPRNMVEVFENEEEDQKTPILSRMRSLRRILSSSSRRFNPFSPVSNNNNNNNVVEQGTTPQS